MENKNIIQYSIFIALFLLCAIGVINLINGSNNIKESKLMLENVLKEVAESKKIVEMQSANIVELQKLNKELSNKVNVVDSLNKAIKKNLDVNFHSANKSINDIKNTIDNIRPVKIH